MSKKSRPKLKTKEDRFKFIDEQATAVILQLQAKTIDKDIARATNVAIGLIIRNECNRLTVAHQKIQREKNDLRSEAIDLGWDRESRLNKTK